MMGGKTGSDWWAYKKKPGDGGEGRGCVESSEEEPTTL